jgi:hypothetical protein
MPWAKSARDIGEMSHSGGGMLRHTPRGKGRAARHVSACLRTHETRALKEAVDMRAQARKEAKRDLLRRRAVGGCGSSRT